MARYRKDALDGVFENGRLPRLIYANRQDFDTRRHDRPMHSHRSLCELLLCYSGSGVYHVGNAAYPVREGDLVFYNAGEMHELVSLADTEIGTYCFGYADVHCKGLPQNHLLGQDGAYVRPAGGLYPFLKELAERILDADQHSREGKANAQLMASSLLLHAQGLQAEKQEAAISPELAVLVSSIKDYIAAHFDGPLSLEDIAAALSVSPATVSHVFKKATGYPPIEYVIRCRIGYAETLLISSDLPVSRIAVMSGYDNITYFQTIFKKLVGMTPLKYRNRYLDELHGERDQT